MTGLTFGEAIRLKTLKKELSGKGNGGSPITVHDTIGFRKMYRDGICLVGKGLYTAMAEFSDMNYALLDDGEQKEIQGLYSRFINYFDPGVNVQVFLFNRRTPEKVLAEGLRIPQKGDGLDPLRGEFSHILTDMCARGTNGVVKGRYIIYGTEAGDIGEARARLRSIGRDLIRNFRQLGTDARILDGNDRLRLLHEFFNQYGMEPFRPPFSRLAQACASAKDSAAPPGFDFRQPSRFKSGRMHGSAHILDITANELTDGLLRDIMDLDSNVTVSVHMQAMDAAKASKMLKGALSDIQKMKIEEQKKAVRSGFDMDILPVDIVLYEKDTRELLDDLSGSNQKILKASIIIACFGRTRAEMEELTQRVAGIVQKASCTLRCLQYRQEEGMNDAAPIGRNAAGEGRSLPTSVVSVLMPFSTQELFMGGEALYYGLNALSSNMVMADRKKLRTPNGVILGTPGSGKSFAAKREILGCFLVTGDEIVICDPEGEYAPLVGALGGQVVRLSAESGDFLNPMDIHISGNNDMDALKIKSDFIITLCDCIAGGGTGLANDEKGIIDSCIGGLYRKYYRTQLPEDMPVLGDLYDALLSYEPEPGKVKAELAMGAREKAVRIANSLFLYVHGSQDYFNHRTNVDCDNRVVCFDIRELGRQLKELGMLIVQDAVWNRVSRNRGRGVATRYYCDEFHLLLRDGQTARYSVEIWKRFRKWGGIPTGLTQNVGDFLRSEEIEGILGNSDFVCLLNQNAKDQAVLAEKLGLSSKQLQAVTNAEPGSGLLLFDRAVVPFVDRYPQDTETYRIMNTRLETSGRGIADRAKGPQKPKRASGQEDPQKTAADGKAGGAAEAEDPQGAAADGKVGGTTEAADPGGPQGDAADLKQGGVAYE